MAIVSRKSNFGDSCFFLDFGTSYVAFFNGHDFWYTDIRTSWLLFAKELEII